MANPYSWYEEDFTSFLLSLDLPAYRENKPLNDIIKEEKEQFVSRFKEMLSLNRFRTFSESFYRALDEKLSDVVSSFQSLLRIIEAYDNADMAKAQLEFDQSFLIYLQIVLAAVSMITSLLFLFGARSSIVKTIQLVSITGSTIVFMIIMIVCANSHAKYV